MEKRLGLAVLLAVSSFACIEQEECRRACAVQGLDYKEDSEICICVDPSQNQQPATTVCGDTLCNGSEHCSTCPEDCEVCPSQEEQPAGCLSNAICDTICQTEGAAECDPSGVCICTHTVIETAPEIATSMLSVRTINTQDAHFTIRAQNAVLIGAQSVVTALGLVPGEYTIHPEDVPGFITPAVQTIVLEPNTSNWIKLYYMPQNHPMIGQIYRYGTLFDGEVPMFGVTVSAMPDQLMFLRKLIYQVRSYGGVVIYGYGLMDREMMPLDWVSVGNMIDITGLSTVSVDLSQGGGALLGTGDSANFFMFGLVSQTSPDTIIVTELVGLEWSDENGDVYKYDIDYPTSRVLGTLETVTSM